MRNTPKTVVFVYSENQTVRDNSSNINAENVLHTQMLFVFILLLHIVCFYFAYIRNRKGYIEAKKFCTKFKFSRQNESVCLIERNIPKGDQFSWGNLSQPVPADVLDNKDKFTVWLNNYLSIDLVEAENGNINSPLKAACDVLRDLRDNIRSLIDFGKLSEESHRWLYSDLIPVMN